MNRRLLIIGLLIAVPVAGVYVAVSTLPYIYYNRLIEGKVSNKYFKLPYWDQRFLVPPKQIEVKKIPDDFSTLWREFHLRDVVIPLPAGHPMFKTIPLVELGKESEDPLLGIQFRSPTGREMARVYLLKNGAWNDHLDDQELFKLPLVRRELDKVPHQQVWKDLFTKNITGWELPWQQMAYNLYILNLRAAMFPQGLLNYVLLSDGKKALVELESKNKDYRTEIIFEFEQGLLLSYLLISELGNTDSQDLRSRFIEKISFRTSTKELAPLIYSEFKQLSFNRQTDQEGMLFLFSAWSHDMDQVDMLKEMIYFLERGEKNHDQLKPLYRYAYKRYNKTFTSRDVGLEEDDDDIRLQRRIELEAIAERKRVLEKAKEPKPLPPPTPKETMDDFLRRAREEKLKSPRKGSGKARIN